MLLEMHIVFVKYVKDSKLSGLIFSSLFEKYRFWQDIHRKGLMATVEFCLVADHLLPSIHFLQTKVCAKLFGPLPIPQVKSPFF